MACVLRCGSAAGFPERLSPTELVMLLEAHGDVVGLMPSAKFTLSFNGRTVGHGTRPMSWVWVDREGAR